MWPFELTGRCSCPVGFEQFHRQTFFNYQFNRAHGLGLADRNDLYNAGSRVRSAADCVTVFETLSQRAATDGQDRHAAGYMRLAEFFTPPQSPAKIERYRHFRALFDHAFVGDGMTRHPVPYAGAALPAYSLRSAESSCRGTVLVHGGFDSLIEEFYAIWQRIAAAGFNVITFEGPGQGGARALEGLTFDHDWEKPVKAVLDHFRIESRPWSVSQWVATGRSGPRAGNAVSTRSSPGRRYMTGFAEYRPRCAVQRGSCCAAGGS